MHRLTSVKAEHLLIRQGLKQALDFFDSSLEAHTLYTRDFSLSVLLTSHAMLNIERGPVVDKNLIVASLFLRMVTSSSGYSFKQTVSYVKKFLRQYPNTVSEERVLAYIMDQETALRPVTDMGCFLHDAEILTFLIQPASAIIDFVQKKTGHDILAARLFLERIAVTQVMYTSLGREMLRDLSSSILTDLRT